MDTLPGIVTKSAEPIRVLGFLASAVVVILSCAAYRYAPFSYHRLQFGELYGSIGFSFTGGQYLFIAAAGYIAILALYFGLEADIGTAKALRLFRVAGRFARAPLTVIRQGLEPADRVAVLTILLKAFFGPMMVMSLLRFCQGALSTGERLLDDGGLAAGLFALLIEHAFWFFMNIILFFDVLLFTVGYLVESPRLRNEIRSVDATLIGWGAALLCYPPFNTLTGSILGSNVSDFPKFDDPTVHVVLNALLLVLMAIYASASVALGWKASNLTHRGIIDRGPYRFIRHPAYVCKNMAWWIGSIPLVGLAFGESTVSGLLAVASVAGWSMLYVLRALTEEDHLKRVDDEYAKYAERVRWGFIPGVI